MSPYRRERQRRRQKVSLAIGGVILIIAIYVRIGALGYDTAAATAEQDARAIEVQLAEGENEIRSLRSTTNALEAELGVARSARAELQRRYDREVSTPATAELLELVQQRLADGLTREQLETALRSAGLIQRCDQEEGRPRRFRVVAGASLPPNAGISFIGGLLRVVVVVPSQSADLATSARTLVHVVGAPTVELTGASHRQPIVIGSAEFMLNVQPAEVRGFAQASVSSC